MFSINKNLNYGRKYIKSYSKGYLKNINKKAVIVDLGSGTGIDLYNVSILGFESEIHSVDHKPNKKINSIFKNKNTPKKHYLNIECEKLPFEDASVDIIIVNQILEHCKEIFWIFHEISRVLKINGIILIGVPNLSSLHNRVLLFLGKQPTCINLNSAHVRGFTYSGINSFLNEAFPGGYKLTKFNGSNFYPFPGFISEILSWVFPKMSVGIFFRFNKTKSYENNFLIASKYLDTNYFSGNFKKI